MHGVHGLPDMDTEAEQYPDCKRDIGDITVNKLFSSTVIIVLFLCTVACSPNSTSDPNKSSGEGAAHASSTKDVAGSGMADVLKNKTLTGYESTTIGSAFDGYKYFAKKEWKETAGRDGKIYIDYIGWVGTKALDAASIKDGISARAIDVKFVINPDGSFSVAMVSKIDAKSDGKFYSYPLEDSAGVLATLYANKEMAF